MKVTVVRTGGVAGIRRTWSVEVSAQPDPTAWERLVDALPWDAPPAEDRAPDRFVYLITVTVATVEEHEVRLGESALDGPWRELVERVRDADS
jgi:hypothetical protein